EETVDGAYYNPLDFLMYWANWVKNFSRCGQPSPDVPATADAPSAVHSEACPPSLKGVKLAWKFEAISLEINCEKVSVEASTTVEGWFGVFGEFNYAPHSGKMTVFAGPKASTKIPGTTIGGSFKDGLYVSFDGQGHPTDFGFRTSVSGAAGMGPFSIKGSD